MLNNTSDFEKQIMQRIDAGELFYCDIQTLNHDGFINDNKMVQRLLRYCKRAKKDEINKIFSSVSHNEYGTLTLCDVLNEYLEDNQVRKIREALEEDLCNG